MDGNDIFSHIAQLSGNLEGCHRRSQHSSRLPLQTCTLPVRSSQKLILSDGRVSKWRGSIPKPWRASIFFTTDESPKVIQIRDLCKARSDPAWFRFTCDSHTNAHNGGCVWDSVDPNGKSHIKGERCYSPFSPARLISYPLWPPGCLPSPPLTPLFVLRKIPLSKWEYGVSASDTKAKTHLSCLNKSDKEMLYELPPEGSPKSRGEQSGHNV